MMAMMYIMILLMMTMLIMMLVMMVLMKICGRWCIEFIEYARSIIAPAVQATELCKAST